MKDKLKELKIYINNSKFTPGDYSTPFSANASSIIQKANRNMEDLNNDTNELEWTYIKDSM